MSIESQDPELMLKACNLMREMEWRALSDLIINQKRSFQIESLKRLLNDAITLFESNEKVDYIAGYCRALKIHDLQIIAREAYSLFLLFEKDKPELCKAMLETLHKHEFPLSVIGTEAIVDDRREILSRAFEMGLLDTSHTDVLRYLGMFGSSQMLDEYSALDEEFNKRFEIVFHGGCLENNIEAIAWLFENVKPNREEIERELNDNSPDLALNTQALITRYLIGNGKRPARQRQSL